MTTITINTASTTSPQNSFALQTQGYTQGQTVDDWASRAWLRPGIVGSAVSTPIYAGLGIAANVNGLNVNGSNATTIVPATTTQINGFTVYDQNINAIQTPGNTAAFVSAGGNVSFYKFGTNATIPLPVASGAVSAIETGNINMQLYWDTVALNITNTSSGNTIALPVTTIQGINSNSKVIQNSSGVLSYIIGTLVALTI